MIAFRLIRTLCAAALVGLAFAQDASRANGSAVRGFRGAGQGDSSR